MVKSKTKLSKIFMAVVPQFSIANLTECRFIFEGDVLDDKQTPDFYCMQNDDIIDLM